MCTGPVATHHGSAAQEPQNFTFSKTFYSDVLNQSHVLASVALGGPAVASEQVYSDCSSCKPLCLSCTCEKVAAVNHLYW